MEISARPSERTRKLACEKILALHNPVGKAPNAWQFHSACDEYSRECRPPISSKLARIESLPQPGSVGMAALWTIAGLVIVCATLREIFRDLFQPSGSGALSSLLGR